MHSDSFRECLNCCFFALFGIGFFSASFVITRGNGSTCGFFCPYSWAMLFTSELNLSNPVTLHVSSLHLKFHGMSCSLSFFSHFINELYFLDFKTMWRKLVACATPSVLNDSMGWQMCELPAGPAGLCGWSWFYLFQDWGGDPGNKAFWWNWVWRSLPSSQACGKHLATQRYRVSRECTASSPGRCFVIFVGNGCSRGRRKDCS